MTPFQFPQTSQAAQTVSTPPINPFWSTFDPDFKQLDTYYNQLQATHETDYWLGPPRFGTITHGTTYTLPDGTLPIIQVTGYRFLVDAIIGTSDLPDWIIVTIRDLSSGINFMNNPVSLINLGGPGSDPVMFYVPRILENGSILQFTVTNTHPITDSLYTEIVYHGVRKQLA